MGIWDYISGTADSLKRNTPDLTAVKNWCPTTESIKRIAPDVTAAKNLGSTAYGYGSATVTQIDDAVRVNVHYYLMDEEGRSKSLLLGTKILKYTTHAVLKTVPGYTFLAESFHGLDESDKQEVHMKALCDEIRGMKKELSEYRKVNESILKLEKEQSAYWKLHEQVPADKPCAELNSPNITNAHSVANQKPEDVIRVFMMKEFMGRKFLDDLMVPPVAPRKK